MKTQSLVCALVATNLMLGVGLFVQNRSVEAQGRPVVLRAQKIELVDASGQVRASLEVAANREAVSAAPGFEREHPRQDRRLR